MMHEPWAGERAPGTAGFQPAFRYARPGDPKGPSCLVAPLTNNRG